MALRLTGLLTAAGGLARQVLPASLAERLKELSVRVLGPKVLYMLRPRLDDVTVPELAAGLRYDAVRPGTEADYVRVMRRSLDAGADAAWFREQFATDPAYEPANLILIREDSRPVAAAAAWQSDWQGETVGLIHNVGVDSDHLGRGLGRAVTLAALERLRSRGFDRAMLGTEDYRLPAIGLYLSLGFEPVPVTWFHRWRWRRVGRRLATYSGKKSSSG